MSHCWQWIIWETHHAMTGLVKDYKDYVFFFLLNEDTYSSALTNM